MATPYEDIYNKASRLITDPELAMFPEEELEDMFHGWLMSAIPKFRKCKNDLSDRNEDEKCFNTDLLDIEQEILAIMMTREWLKPQLDSVLLTRQVFTDNESKFYSQAAHLTALEERDEKLRIEAQKLQRDYTFNNSNYWEG